MQIDQRLPRYQQLRDILLAEITSGRWDIAQPIPSESELIAQYKLAAGTVRKAIDSLVAEGVLERFQGRGTFLRRPTFETSLFRFFRFTRLHGEAAVPKSKIIRKTLAQIADDDAKKLALPAGTQTLHIQRLRLVENEPVLFENIWLPVEKFALLLQTDIEHQGDLLYPLYESHCHQVIACARETLTVQSADTDFAALFSITQGEPLIAIERIAENHCGEPLELRRSVGLATKFRYEVTIR